MSKKALLLGLNIVATGTIIIGLLISRFGITTIGNLETFTDGDFELTMIFAVGLPILIMVKVDHHIRAIFN